MKSCPTCRQRFSGDARFCPFDGVPLAPAKLEPLGEDPLLQSAVDGRYLVLERLGEGGTGRVYKVQHTVLSRLFAMKVLRRDLARDEELAGRFIQEAKATASIRHPNIVEITDFGQLPDGVPYLVMELLVGRSLGQVIKADGPMPAARATPILRQIASALAAAHAAGVVHRDLKPENIFLLEGTDEVRIVDFGAAKVIGASRVTKDGIVFGTPHYMSPEQASGHPVDHRADIYSLGVIMYELFTGRVPFEADTYMGVLTQHMFVRPVPPSQANDAVGVLGGLEEITLVCLSKKPEDRYPSMERVLSEIDRAAATARDASIDAVARALVPSAAPRGGWRRAVRGAAFGAASVACVGVAIGLLLRRPSVPAVSGHAVFEAAAEVSGRPAYASGTEGGEVTKATTAPAEAPSAATAAPTEIVDAAASTPAMAGNGARAATSPAPVAKPPRRRAWPRSSAMDDVGDPFATSR